MRVQVTAICIAHAAVSQACPKDMVVAMDGVCIDRYEWPNQVGVRPRIAMSGQQEAYGPPGYDAEMLCRSVGKRPVEYQEWVAACKGPNEAPYPYGEVYDVDACNTGKQWRSFDEHKVWLRDANELDRLDQSYPAGQFSRCVSAKGAYDMVGNAEEWVRCSHGKFGWCLVGGYWAHNISCTAAIVVHSPYWHFFETSFRCALDI